MALDSILGQTPDLSGPAPSSRAKRCRSSGLVFGVRKGAVAFPSVDRSRGCYGRPRGGNPPVVSHSAKAGIKQPPFSVPIGDRPSACNRIELLQREHLWWSIRSWTEAQGIT
jgi:hypothetical protein